MIAEAKNQEPKVLLLVPYYTHRTVEGFLKDVDPKVRVFTYNFNENPSEDWNPAEFDYHEFSSSFCESRTQFDMDPDREAHYAEELPALVREMGIDTVIPAKEKYVAFLAKHQGKFGDKVFVPSLSVVNLLQNKALAYDFFGLRGIPVPANTTFTPENNSKLEDFLREQGIAFVKPCCESGGKRVGQVSSIEEMLELYGATTDELVACELLQLPEYNHTVMVRNGLPNVHATYTCLGSANQDTANMTYSPELDSLVEKIISNLGEAYGRQNIDGVYNIDFLKNSQGEFLLSEVNVGRLPGRHSVFTPSGLNLSDTLVDNSLNRSHAYSLVG